MMRKLIVLSLVLATLYGSYWFIGRGQIQSRLTDAIAEMDAGVVDIDYATLSTRGFPSRFDTTLTDLVVEDPTAGVRWETPIFQLLALSYRPNDVRAYFPEEQVFVVDGERFTLTTDEMAARGQVSANAALTFQQAELELLNPRLRTEEGAELSLTRLFAATRLTPATTQTYDVFLEARDITLPDDIRALLDPGNLQPPTITTLRVEADIDLNAPLALNTTQAEPHWITDLRIQEFDLSWGEMSLTAIGDLTPTEFGVLNGSVTLTARYWRQALELGLANGMINEDNRFLITGIATSLDETPDFPDTLTLTLTVTDGMMALGNLPLGLAPILR